MNFVFPLLAAVLQAGSFTIDKAVLGIRRVSFKTYTGKSFPLIFLITFIIFVIFRPPFSAELLGGDIGYLLLISIGMLVATNILFYRALEEEQLGEIQTLDLLRSIPIIIFSGIIFTDERRFWVILPALIASGAIIWSHWKHRHFRIRKNTLPFFLWSLTAAPIGASISKLLLRSWNPISLELVRSGALAVIFGAIFRRQRKGVSPEIFPLFILTNILSAVAWILFYFSYQRAGIIYTILLFSLQPLLVYFASLFFLKEPFRPKKFIAFLVVLVSIVVAQINS